MRLGVSFVKSAVYCLNIFLIYYVQGFENNERFGYGWINIGYGYAFALILAILFASYLIHRKYEKPSDYFLLLYGLIVVAPYMLLYDIWGGGWRYLLLIVAPFFLVMLICGLRFRVPTVSVILEDNVVKGWLLVSLIIVVFLLLNRPLSASLSLADTYVRRLEARALYGSGTLVAYMSSIVMNGVLPLLAFVGVRKKNILLCFFALLIYLVFYFIYGVKAPVLYMLFAGVFAYFLRKDGGGGKFYWLIYYIFVSLFAVAWLEFFLLGYSYAEDYIIRRVFYVGSYLIGAYFDVLDGVDFSWVSGIPTSKPASMYVGEVVLGQPGTNANTNTFLYLLAQHGIGGYVLAITVVSGVLASLNSLRFKSEVFIFLSLMYSVLILEQSATTALLSSGIGVLTVCFYFSRPAARNTVRGAV